MLVPRQEYSRELKMACMRELDSGESLAEVARQYQLSPKRLETWKGEWRAKGELAFPGKAARPQARLDAERLAELERKIGQQAMEIDFLKKVLRRFREHPLLLVGNGGAASTSRSGKRLKRGRAAGLRFAGHERFSGEHVQRRVTFGGVKAAFTVNSGTQITATVPSGAATGKIAIKTPGGSASSKTSFTVQ